MFSLFFPILRVDFLSDFVFGCRKRLSSNFRVLLWEFANPFWARYIIYLCTVLFIRSWNSHFRFFFLGFLGFLRKLGLFGLYYIARIWAEFYWVCICFWNRSPTIFLIFTFFLFKVKFYVLLFLMDMLLFVGWSCCFIFWNSVAFVNQMLCWNVQ